MKKLIALLLAISCVVGLCACGGGADAPKETEPKLDVTATDADKAALDGVYANRVAYHGQLHDHANTGGTSDGKNTLKELKANLKTKDMDFTDVADHKQVLHMRLEDWDDTLFIGGSEAASQIKDVKSEGKEMHYNMMATTPEQVEAVLNHFATKYKYIMDHFGYPSFTKAELTELAELLYEQGGLFVHVHPKGKSYIQSEDPLDYWYTDKMGIEVMTGCYGDMRGQENADAYKLWTDLLAMGKKIWAMCGSDSHRLSDTHSLATVYSDEKDAKKIFGYVRVGDVTAGPAGIRMAIGDTAMGGTTDFAGKRLVISAGDIHSKEYNPSSKYELHVYDDKGLVFTEQLSGNETNYFAIDVAADAKFYRAEIYHATEKYIFAVGNPIWNG